MSATASVARWAVGANSFVGNARILRRRTNIGTASGLLSLNFRNLPRQIPAVALLIPLRHISTEPNRGGPGSGPPPGFNVDEAKKPLPKEAQAGSKKDQKPQDKAEGPTPAQELAKEGLQEDASLTALAEKRDALMDKREEERKEEKKLTVWEKVKKEVRHYWDGTKLLAAEVKISSKLALKMAAGYELTRRETRQLERTVQDLARLVPFSVFVIVPFAELLLPFAIKLFPGLLPSTYEGQKFKDAKASTLRATRKDVSNFLRGTLKETGLPVTVATAQKEEFGIFFRKLRATGEKPTDEDVIKVCKIFRDDLTLDNLSRPQLVSMCRYMNLSTFGADVMLRYQVRHRMRQIKRDDKAISFEGVDSLTVSELQTACASRGIRTHGVSPARMRADLQVWLDLRLREGVPSTLLVLSNAYMYSGEMTSQIDALTGVLSSIPEELYHEIELHVHNAEGAATNKQRLEVLKEQQEMIDEENEQNEEHQSTGFATPRDTENIDEKEEKQSQETQAAANAAGERLAERKQAQEMAEAQAEGLKVRREEKGHDTVTKAEGKSGEKKNE